MEKVKFIGGAYTARSVNVEAQRCINLYPEMDETGDGKEPAALYGTPGLTLHTTQPGAFANRAGGGYVTSTGRWFNVCGNKLNEIYEDGTVTNRGTLFTNVGPVYITDNGATASIGGDQLLITDGTYGYILNFTTNVFEQISDSDFPGGGTCTFMNQFFLVSKPGSREFFASDILNGLAWDALSFGVKESQPDPVIAIKSNGQYLWVWGSQSYEVWYGSDDQPFPFARVLGTVGNIGCASAASVIQMKGSMFWLGDGSEGRGVVFMSDGNSAVRISTHAIEYYLAQQADLSTTIAWCYEREGHYFYALSLQTANRTLVYDLTTGIWHERAYLDPETGNFTRHRGISCVFYKGKNYVGDYSNGNIYLLDELAYTDNGNPLKRLRATSHTSEKNRRMTIDRLQVLIQSGVGTQTGQGVDPKLMLRVSKDFGHTWGPERTASMGKVGEYSKRAMWNLLGQGRDFVFEVSCSDPVKVVFIEALVAARMGDD